eukprot:GFYU01001121.1.p1 GENE.GFYU01001121.1~~GFYU01001121.1.p1  ORF type:complete len:157 (+),score=11.80 GFYU01001121.1:41-511(+)
MHSSTKYHLLSSTLLLGCILSCALIGHVSADSCSNLSNDDCSNSCDCMLVQCASVKDNWVVNSCIPESTSKDDQRKVCAGYGYSRTQFNCSQSSGWGGLIAFLVVAAVIGGGAFGFVYWYRAKERETGSPPVQVPSWIHKHITGTTRSDGYVAAQP